MKATPLTVATVAITALTLALLLLLLEPWSPAGPAAGDPSPDVAAPQLAEQGVPAPAPDVATLESTPDALPDAVRSEATSLAPDAVLTQELLIVATWAAPLGQLGPPAAGITLELGAASERSLAGRGMLQVETNERGLARASLPWVAVEAVGPPGRRLVFARTTGNDLLERLVTQRASRRPSAPIELHITAQRGMLLEGRLLGPDGAPAQGRVTRWREHPDGSRSQSPGDWAGDDGRFAVEITEDGIYRLSAVGTRRPWRRDEPDARFELGNAVSGLLSVRLDEAPPDVELVLSGGGALRGRTMDATGRSLGGVSLRAVPVELQRAGSRSSAVVAELQAESRGHTDVRGDSDSAGEFHFEGLRPGEYSIFAVVGSTSHPEERLLTPTPVPSDGTPLVLRVTRPHLAIHVRDEGGSVPSAAIEVLQTRRQGRVNGTADRPGLLVTRRGGRDALLGSAAALRPRPAGPGEFALELDVGDAVEIALVGGGCYTPPRTIFIPPGAGRIDVDLVLRRTEAVGTLALDIQDEAGRGVAGDLMVRLVHAGSGMELLHLSWRYRSSGELEVPVGEHLLVVEGQPRVAFSLGPVKRPRELGGFEAPVTIRPGETTHVVATLSEPARIDVTLVGKVEDGDLDVAQAQVDGWLAPDEIEARDLVAKVGQVTLHLERPGRGVEPLSFATHELEGTRSAGPRPLPFLGLGAQALSEPLTPGDCTLVARLPGGREARRALTLMPGETLAVTLSFD